MGLIDCLKAYGFHEEAHQDYILAIAKKYKDSGMDQRSADIKAIRDMQESTLDSLMSVYHQAGVKGYETVPIEALPPHEQQHLENRVNDKISSGKLSEQMVLPFFEEAIKKENNESKSTQPTGTEQPNVTGNITEDTDRTQGTGDAAGIPGNDDAGTAGATEGIGNIEGSAGGEQQVPEGSTTEGQGEVTGIKNRIYDSEREQQGKEVINTSTGSAEKHFDNTVKKIQSGEIPVTEIRKVAEKIALGEKPPTNMTPAEIQDALNYDKITLNKEYGKLFDDLNDAYAKDDKEAQKNLILKQIELEKHLEDNYIASKKTGSEWSAIGRARQLELHSDYSLANVTNRFKAANEGKSIPENIKKQLVGFAQKIEESTAKIADLTKAHEENTKAIQQLTEEKQKLSAELAVEKARKDAYKERVDTRSIRKENLDAQKSQIKQDIKKKWQKYSKGQLNAGIPLPLEMVPDIAKLAKVYALEGINTLEGMLDKLHEDISEVIPNIDKRSLRDALSGYGKSFKLSDDEINVNLREIKRQGRLVSALEDAQNAEIPKRSGLQRDAKTETVKDLERKVTEEMRKQGIEFDKKAKSPDDQWRTALQAYKTRLENKQKYYEGIAQSKDIDKFLADKKKTTLALDNEATQLKIQVAKAKNEIDKLVKEREYQNMSSIAKGLNWFSRFRKGVVITSLQTVEKLFGAATWRPFLKTPYEVLAFGLSHIPGIRKIAEGAPTEGIMKGKDLAKSLGEYYSALLTKQTYADAGNIMKTGKSPEDLLHGKLSADLAPTSAVMKTLEYYGRSHKMIKYPIFKAEFKSAAAKAMAYEIRQGNDPSDPMVQEVVNQRAMNEGLRAIFSQNNDVVKIQRMVEHFLDAKGHNVTAALLRSELPITKIPTNYLSEGGSLFFGGLRAAPKLIQAITKGVESLKPEEKDFIMRNLKLQGAGVALWMVGYATYKAVTPFYGIKKKEDEEDTVFGIPHLLTHNPAAEILRLGASYRWKKEQLEDQNKENPGWEAFAQSSAGLLHESPYYQEGKKLFDIAGAKGGMLNKAGKYAGEFLGSTFIPPDVTKLAKYLDKDENGNTVKRTPTDMKETFESKLPVLRKNVPQKGGLRYGLIP